MDDSKLIVVADFPNRIEAEIAQGALEAAGIESFVSADDAGGLRPSLWLSGVRLIVREDVAADARNVLNVPNP